MRTRFFVCMALVLAPSLPAQRAMTSADYARAERWMSYNVNPLITGGVVRPNWLPDDRLWWRNTTSTGSELVLLEPATALRKRCDTVPDRCGLPADSAGGGGRGGRGGGRGAAGRAPDTMSPDGQYGAFIRDWNLWVRDTHTGQETQLT